MLNSSTEQIGKEHYVAAKGQKNSRLMPGTFSTTKGSEHLKGQISRACRVSETHFMQYILWQLPLHLTGFMQTSVQMPHSYFYRSSLVLRKFTAVNAYFSIVLSLNDYKVVWLLDTLNHLIHSDQPKSIHLWSRHFFIDSFHNILPDLGFLLILTVWV